MATKKFAGKESRKEEMAEAEAIKSGRVTPAQYAAREALEERRMKNGGKAMGYAKGGKVMGYANGGMIKAGPAPNVCEYTQGPGVRSQQDYHKK